LLVVLLMMSTAPSAKHIFEKAPELRKGHWYEQRDKGENKQLHW